jgi:hypothetical protein
MTDLVLPGHVAPIRWQLRIRWIALLAATILVAALSSIQVEQCRTTPGAFSAGFSNGFDVSRKVCRQITLGQLVAGRL